MLPHRHLLVALPDHASGNRRRSGSPPMDADDPAAAAASSSPASDDAFFDALDTLPSPPSPPTLRRVKILKQPDDTLDTLPSPPSPPNTTSSSTLRRRLRRVNILKQPDDALSSAASPAASTVTAVDEPVKFKPDDSSEDTSAAYHPPSPPHEEEDGVGDKGADAVAVAQDRRPTPAPSILESLAVFVIKAVVFQVSALISCLTFPVRLLQWWFLFVTDPRALARRARAWALGAAGQATGAVTARLGGGEGMGRVVARLVWGSLWAVYVCVVLCALLAMAFLGGGLLVGRVVEEPVQVTETLNFDYTKPSPVAFVPVRPLVPPNQRMQLEVLLTLPESDYNRRLGVFQVRAELLSAEGKVISTSSQPCMLKFKSVHMHFIETFLRSVSLLSGYSSESQVIRLKMSGITEAFEPITGLRIILEQRAEFSPGAGIPEIYAASLKLEAELPLLKRILWNWRWTLFVWSSMGFFVFELLLAFVCCRPCIFPRNGHNAVVA